MRSLRLLLVAHLAALSPMSAQDHPGLREAPSGTNWIADRKEMHYYPVDCTAARSVPRDDRLYYATESALIRDGYVRSLACGGRATARLEDAPPRLQDSQPVDDHPRRGLWFSGGLGYGTLGCDNCSGREGGLTGGLQLGGSVSQKVLLGGGTTGWTKSEGGATLTVGTVVALIRFYPSSTSGFFLLGGLGLGTISAEVVGFGSETESGAGVLLGLGWDLRVGRNVSLTPFWNGFAARTSNADANVGQLGLSVTLH